MSSKKLVWYPINLGYWFKSLIFSNFVIGKQHNEANFILKLTFKNLTPLNLYRMKMKCLELTSCRNPGTEDREQ